MKMVMDIQEVLKYLPHRPPFLLIDGVKEFKHSDFLVAIKNVTMNEPFFVGHFPGEPVMPGVLIIEALAQAGAILAYKSIDQLPSDGVLFLFAGIENARFRKVVKPGDQLQLEAKFLWEKRDLWKIEGRATVDGEVVCSADLMSFRTTKEPKNDS